MKRFIFLQFVLLIATVASFSQGTWLNPLPQGNTLWAISAIDSLNCFTAGEYGTVMKTTDGGTTWLVVSSGTTEDIASIDFPDPTHGWFATRFGKIFYTGDAGTTWTMQYADPDSARLNALKFTGTTHGCAVGSKTGNNMGKILMTYDGGITWIEDTTAFPNTIVDVSFPDPTHGWAVDGHGIIYQSNNGGMSWTLNKDFGPFVWFNSISFADSLHGWISNGYQNNMYKTADGGQTWIIKAVSRSAQKIEFTDILTGYRCGIGWRNNQNQGWVMKTTDGGTNWSSVTWLDISLTWSLGFCNSNTGWLTGSSGTIFKTTDGNATWSKQTFDYAHDPINAASFLQNGTLGWVAAGPGKIIHSDDSGNTWSYQTTGIVNYLTDIKFTDPLNGWACGEQGRVLHTTDGGSSWALLPAMTVQSLRAVFFPTLNRGIIAGDSGIVLSTTDRGINWEKTVPFGNTDINTLFFTDSLYGWAAGFAHSPDWGACIMRTTDGGVHWDSVMIGQNGFPYSIFFTDRLNGWVTGSNNILLRTLDGGITWDDLECGIGNEFRSVFFRDPLHGVVGGAYGILARSYDGGISWERVETGHGENIASLYVNSEGTCWSAGGFGCILSYSDIFTAIHPVNAPPVCPTITISPNPFMAETNITYFIKELQHVSLSVYSITGRKLVTLVDEDQLMGYHSAAFIRRGLNPGIYICKLQSGNSTTSAKLIVVDPE